MSPAAPRRTDHGPRVVLAGARRSATRGHAQTHRRRGRRRRRQAPARIAAETRSLGARASPHRGQWSLRPRSGLTGSAPVTDATRQVQAY